MYKALFHISFFILFWVPIASGQMDDGFLDQEEDKSKKEKRIVSSVIRKWELKDYGVFQDTLKLDTLLDNAHIYHPMYKKGITNTYLGNYGTPFLDNNFFNRELKPEGYFFLQSREGYLLMPSGVQYLNTTTPITVLDFTQSENKSRKNETRFNVLHSQNVNPYWNFTFRWDQAKSKGQYAHQETKNSFVTLYTNYNKDKWSVHSGFISNQIKGEENGGLVRESDIYSSDDTDYLPVRLENSKSGFNSTYMYSDAEYKVGKYDAVNDSVDEFRPIVGFIYSFKYERHKQEFIENENFDTVFWNNTYYPEGYENDSIRFNKLTNLFQLKQYENKNKKTTFGKRAFLGHELIRGSMPGIQINDTTHIREGIRYSNVFVGAGIFRETGEFWRWRFDGRINIIGRNAGETDLNGWIAKPFRFLGDSTAALVFDGNFKNTVADPFQKKFFSNHIRWDKNFSMMQSISVGGKFVSDKRRYSIGAKYAIINNYIYNDTLGIPSQSAKDLNVLAVFADKCFKIRNFYLHANVLWQKASNEEVLHVPEFSGLMSAYYQIRIAKVLYAQFGTDVRYNTLYYADAYSPSTGLFHLQNEKKYGNYPYIDVNANLRLKRTTVFFKLMNIGTHFLDGEFITSPYYPMYRSTFRFGVRWAFYD